MESNRPEISVIVPAYNEAENMSDLFSELASTFRKHDLSAEVALVDDGSTDGTLEAARVAADRAGLEGVRLLRHRHNRGKTEALLTAARTAQGNFFVLFDADLQHSTEEIPRFVDALKDGFDVVAGRKVGRYEKRLVSSAYNRLSRWIFRVPVHDLNSIKAFRRDILEDLRLRHDWHRYLVVLAHAQGYRVTEIDVELFPRRRGESKFTGQGRVVIGMLDLIAVWFQLVFSRKPMLFFGVTGFAILGLGVLVGLLALYFRYALGEGFRPLLTLVALLTTVGLVMLVAGFLAELIASLRSEVEDLRRKLER